MLVSAAATRFSAHKLCHTLIHRARTLGEMESSTLDFSRGGGAKRGRSQDLEFDLEAERKIRRRIQRELSVAMTQKSRDEHTILELRAALRSMQEQVAAANQRADEAQARALEAARRAAAADARALEVSESMDAVEEEIDALLSEYDDYDEFPRCPICLEDISHEEAWAPTCGHRLHLHCMMELMSHPACASRCPVCREPLRVRE